MLSSNQQLPLEATPSLQAEPIKKKEKERRDKKTRSRGGRGGGRGETISEDVIVNYKHNEYVKDLLIYKDNFYGRFHDTVIRPESSYQCQDEFPLYIS